MQINKAVATTRRAHGDWRSLQ